MIDSERAQGDNSKNEWFIPLCFNLSYSRVEEKLFVFESRDWVSLLFQ